MLAALSLGLETAAEIANYLGVTVQGIHYHLSRLQAVALIGVAGWRSDMRGRSARCYKLVNSDLHLLLAKGRAVVILYTLAFVTAAAGVLSIPANTGPDYLVNPYPGAALPLGWTWVLLGCLILVFAALDWACSANTVARSHQ